jgi:hypothetical protein
VHGWITEAVNELMNDSVNEETEEDKVKKWKIK